MESAQVTTMTLDLIRRLHLRILRTTSCSPEDMHLQDRLNDLLVLPRNLLRICSFIMDGVLKDPASDNQDPKINED